MRSSARTPRPAARSRMMRLRLLPVAHRRVSMPPMVCVVCPARMASSAWLSPWRVRCQARRVPVHPAGGSSVAWSGSGRPASFSMLVSSAMATRARIPAAMFAVSRSPESYWRRLRYGTFACAASCGQLHPRSVRILRITVVAPSPSWGVSPVSRAGLTPRVFAHCRIWSGSSVDSGVSPFSIRSTVAVSTPVSRARVCSRTLSRSLIARSSAAPMGMVLPLPLICRLLGRCRTGARVRRGRCRCRWPGWPRGCRSCSVRRVCFGRRTRRARR